MIRNYSARGVKESFVHTAVDSKLHNERRTKLKQLQTCRCPCARKRCDRVCTKALAVITQRPLDLNG
jgi:hypothetical protein